MPGKRGGGAQRELLSVPRDRGETRPTMRRTQREMVAAPRTQRMRMQQAQSQGGPAFGFAKKIISKAADSVGDLPIFATPRGFRASPRGGMSANVRYARVKDAVKFAGEESGVFPTARVATGRGNAWDVLAMAGLVPVGKGVRPGVKMARYVQKASRKADGRNAARKAAEDSSEAYEAYLAATGAPDIRQLLAAPPKVDARSLFAVPDVPSHGGTRVRVQDIPKLRPQEKAANSFRRLREVGGGYLPISDATVEGLNRQTGRSRRVFGAKIAETDLPGVEKTGPGSNRQSFLVKPDGTIVVGPKGSHHHMLVEPGELYPGGMNEPFGGSIQGELWNRMVDDFSGETIPARLALSGWAGGKMTKRQLAAVNRWLMAAGR